MNSFLSYKLKCLSFFLMLLVVLLHSSLLDYSTGISYSIQCFITVSVTRIAVPLFFIISGFLFFIDKNVTLNFFKIQYLKRAKSLLMPYCFWCGLGCIMWAIYQQNFWPFEHFSFNPPRAVYQLWFLRDLILCVIMSPLIYVALKYLKIMAVILLFFLMPHVSFVEGFSLFDFALGAYIALNKLPFISDERIFPMRTFFMGMIWGGGCFFQYYSYGMNYTYISHIIILLGIIFVWILYNIIHRTGILHFRNDWVLSTSFFIYLFHEPLLSIIKKTALIFNPNPNFGTMIVYVLSFMLTTTICILVAHILNRKIPVFYNFITGGRTIK